MSQNRGVQSEKSAPGQVDVTVVIPAKNEGENIGKCLEAALSQDTGYSIEIVVVDSGSTDNTVEIVKGFPGVRLIQIKPEEFAHGKTRNLGAGKGSGKYLVFLNADAVPADDKWLAALIDNLVENEKTAGVFSRQLPRPGCPLYMVRDMLRSMPPVKRVKADSGYLDFMIFSTVSCALKKEVWKSFPFDDHIIIAEDQEWAKRVLREGYEIVYEPLSLVYHSHDYKLKELFHLKVKVGRSEKKFATKAGALLAGLLPVLAGFFVRVVGDVAFILFDKRVQASPVQKIKQLFRAAAARGVGFFGRYIGWLGAKSE